MTKYFDHCVIYVESSSPDTDSDGLAEAMRLVSPELFDNVYYTAAPDMDGEDDDGYRPGNHGQYTQEFEISFPRAVTEDELHALLERIDMDSYGFGNGYEISYWQYHDGSVHVADAKDGKHVVAQEGNQYLRDQIEQMGDE